MRLGTRRDAVRPPPQRPYQVLGSVSTGVLEASIFLWHGTEMMLENLYCEDSKKG